jgi:hypothetical protein
MQKRQSEQREGERKRGWDICGMYKREMCTELLSKSLNGRKFGNKGINVGVIL